MRIIYFLLLIFIRTAYSEIQASCSEITTIIDAKNYFSTQDENNVLLTSVKSQGSVIEFTFEGNIIQEVDSNIISSVILNKDTWLAYITYNDSTVQDVPYLGSSLGLTTSNIVNSPYPDCPLTALLNFTTMVPGKIEITIVGRDIDSHNFTHLSKEVTTSHLIPVIGMYADFENQVIVNFLSPTGVLRSSQTIFIQTAAYSFNSLTIEENKLSASNPHFFLLGEGIFDEQGYLRWYVLKSGPAIDVNYLFPISGGLLAQIDPNNVTNVYIRDYSGEILQRFFVPNGAHHEVNEKTPGGNLIVLSNVAGPDNATHDRIVEIDRSTGSIVKQWDMADYFQRDRPKDWITIIDTPAFDWFHENAVSYDPTDNTLLISGRHQTIVTKIGYDDGTVKWIICNHQNWSAPYTDYLLTPTNFNTTLDPDQDWTYLQHHARLLPNGDILVYDNGGTRPGFTNNPDGYSDPFYDASPLKELGLPKVSGYARAAQFRVDPIAMTVTKVMEYSHFDYPTTIVGSVHYLAEDILMIGYGEVGKLRISNIVTGELLFSAQRDTLFYRSYLVQFYPGAYTLL